MKKYFFAVILGICFLSSVGAQSVKVFRNEGFILLGNFNKGLGGRVLQSFDLDISSSWVYPRFGALVGVSTIQGYEEYGSHNDKISSFNLSADNVPTVVFPALLEPFCTPAAFLIISAAGAVFNTKSKLLSS